MVKRGKQISVILISILITLLIVSIVSAGLWDRIKKSITGEATQTVELNITVGAPSIIIVYNDSIEDLSSGPNSAPSNTNITINFTVYNPSGAGNLNDSTALANISLADEDTRTNSSCSKYESSGDYANYTCEIMMWWWDGTGNWAINAYIEDNQSNSAINTSTVVYVGENSAFSMSPSSLTWSGIASGATNQTSNNDPLLLNNTGNDVIDATNIEINSSNLRGETTPTEALWAGNFSVSHETGGTCTGAACLECAGTQMVRDISTGIATANLTKGNYTINDGNTGQEQLYVCLRLAGNELSTQSYSTANETEWDWVIKTS